MFTIGDFARTGRVSVRMLRHYDATGLLRPAHVDPASGYRYYTAGQLSRLNRIVALKDLGFTLQQVLAIIDEAVGPDELRGMLRLRRAELEAAVTAAAARLVQVEGRLRAIESEGRMPTNEVVVKPIPALRVAALSATAGSYAPEDIGPVIGPLYEQLLERLTDAGITPTGPGVAWYEDAADGRITVHAGIEVSSSSLPSSALPGGLRVVDLPPIAKAATIVHHGSMDAVVPTEQTLTRWIDGNGYRAAGYAREVSLECPENRDDWVTELQTPLA
ncbi:MerR family transcriptional regulator [Actinoplanes sp. DH11]|uniref:MerR family transcriptional regulator n=1 Tax=Actinoplanes sp. DH11 TaxID=2857011 RepID=UPI001E387DE5|nr:MerR family transcriptional regulator [Actinoplanes sp. DH11]